MIELLSFISMLITWYTYIIFAVVIMGWLLAFNVINGRNPMVAYVAGSLLLMPLLHLTGAVKFFDAMNTNAWIGFLRGVLFTAIVSLVTIFFTKKKLFWKT